MIDLKANPFYLDWDGIVQAFADTFGKNVGTVRNLFDLCSISFAISIGHLFSDSMKRLSVI